MIGMYVLCVYTPNMHIIGMRAWYGGWCKGERVWVYEVDG